MSRGTCMPNTVLGSFQSLALNLHKVRCSPHFTDREIEAQRDDSSCPKPYSKQVVEWGFEPFAHPRAPEYLLFTTSPHPTPLYITK